MKNLLLIPAFNEEPTLPRLIEAARQFIRDILVIDDGSEDATTLVSAMAGAMVHRLKTNAGKGEALKTGFKYALDTSYDWVITMDGDGQHAPSDIATFLPMLAGPYDLILGNRMGDRTRLPFVRRVANRSSSFIVSLLCGRRVPDSQTGFRAYRSDLLRRVALHSSRYDLETEIIIKAARKGFRIGHCRIQTIYSGEVSRFRNVQDSLRFLAVVFKSFFWW
jgi:UDP-N-acetylglucosamine---dolichyl-phosphate N-acetylglucosaminyltransferase